RRQPVLQGNVLRTQMFLDGHRKIGATFDRGIVGSNDAGTTRDVADSADQAGSGDLIVIHSVGSQRAEFDPWRTPIEQGCDPFASSQFAALFVKRDGVLRPA